MLQVGPRVGRTLNYHGCRSWEVKWCRTPTVWYIQRGYGSYNTHEGTIASTSSSGMTRIVFGKTSLGWGSLDDLWEIHQGTGGWSVKILAKAILLWWSIWCERLSSYETVCGRSGGSSELEVYQRSFISPQWHHFHLGIHTTSNGLGHMIVTKLVRLIKVGFLSEADKEDHTRHETCIRTEGTVW